MTPLMLCFFLGGGGGATGTISRTFFRSDELESPSGVDSSETAEVEL